MRTVVVFVVALVFTLSAQALDLSSLTGNWASYFPNGAPHLSNRWLVREAGGEVTFTRIVKGQGGYRDSTTLEYRMKVENGQLVGRDVGSGFACRATVSSDQHEITIELYYPTFKQYKVQDLLKRESQVTRSGASTSSPRSQQQPQLNQRSLSFAGTWQGSVHQSYGDLVLLWTLTVSDDEKRILETVEGGSHTYSCYRQGNVLRISGKDEMGQTANGTLQFEGGGNAVRFNQVTSASILFMKEAFSYSGTLTRPGVAQSSNAANVSRGSTRSSQTQGRTLAGLSGQWDDMKIDAYGNVDEYNEEEDTHHKGTVTNLTASGFTIRWSDGERENYYFKPDKPDCFFTRHDRVLKIELPFCKN